MNDDHKKYLEYLMLNEMDQHDGIRISLSGMIDGRKNSIGATEISLSTLEKISRRFSSWRNYYMFVDDHLCRLNNIKIDFKQKKATMDFSTIDRTG